MWALHWSVVVAGAEGAGSKIVRDVVVGGGGCSCGCGGEKWVGEVASRCVSLGAVAVTSSCSGPCALPDLLGSTLDMAVGCSGVAPFFDEDRMAPLDCPQERMQRVRSWLYLRPQHHGSHQQQQWKPLWANFKPLSWTATTRQTRSMRGRRREVSIVSQVGTKPLWPVP